MTDNDGAALPHSPLHVTPARLAVVVAAALALGAGLSAALRGSGEPAVAREANFTVEGTRVEVRAGAPTWTYLAFADAALQPALLPPPVPGRVAVDEARAQPIEAPLPGRIDTVAVKLGERVEPGEHLIAVRSPDLVDLAKELDQIKSKEAAKAKTVERLRALVALAAEPEKKLVEAEQEHTQAQLARAAAEAKLRSLSVATASEGLYWLTAPRAGVVVARDALAGQQVGPERSDPLLVIAALDEVIVTADVPEASVGELRVGQTARILESGASDGGVSGTIESIGAVVDPQRRMVDVRVRVPNAAGRLRPNGFVQVAFTPDEQPRVVVPVGAVVTDDQESFVFVRAAGSDTALDRRQVTLGHQQGGQVEVLSGLAPGEAYVTKGALLLLNAVDLASQ
ncbi:efflux RND transporter periplasmic adaptor subunit [bacterium]|nr:efflux RND transporter periplasmic adaptor subunit [bacterium]